MNGVYRYEEEVKGNCFDPEIVEGVAGDGAAMLGSHGVAKHVALTAPDVSWLPRS